MLSDFLRQNVQHEASDANEAGSNVFERRPVQEDTFGSDNADEGVVDQGRRKITPWWKQPSPWWLLAAMPFTSMASSAKIAPRIAIYTSLACVVHRPDIHTIGQDFDFGFRDYATPASYLPSYSIKNHSFTHHYISHSFFNGNEPYDLEGEVDPPPPDRNTCVTDPVVQAAVAKLISVIAACTGILSFVTTGWWGAFSDRHGRVRVLGITLLGLLLDDIIFIFVTKFTRFFPGGYWFLVVGSAIDGCLGGFTTGVAATHAYLSDTTDEDNRSRILSLNVGLLFTGMALGPTLGSLLICITGQVVSVFYAAVIFTMLFLILMWLVLPESVTEEQIAQAKTMYHADLLDSAAELQSNSAVGLFHKIKRATVAILSPLTVFTPSESRTSSNGHKIPGKAWNLALLALAYGFTISVMGSYQNKLQYAASKFGWSTETIGYWLSLISATRAVFMTVILPIAIKILMRLPTPQSSSPTEISPLLEPPGNESRRPSSTGPGRMKKGFDSPSFDLGLARFSLVMDIISFLFLAMAETGRQFTIFGVLGALGLGFNPAMQSVTLALYTRRGGIEAGRLFGALSVIQALSSQILGPALYGFVYANTVRTAPRAIFFVTVATVIISLFLLLLVRLPKEVVRNGDSRTDPEVLAPGPLPAS